MWKALFFMIISKKYFVVCDPINYSHHVTNNITNCNGLKIMKIQTDTSIVVEIKAYLNLISSEEHIRFKKIQCLIYNIHFFATAKGWGWASESRF